jgi:hypothetical protein
LDDKIKTNLHIKHGRALTIIPKLRGFTVKFENNKTFYWGFESQPENQNSDDNVEKKTENKTDNPLNFLIKKFNVNKFQHLLEFDQINKIKPKVDQLRKELKEKNVRIRELEAKLQKLRGNESGFVNLIEATTESSADVSMSDDLGTPTFSDKKRLLSNNASVMTTSSGFGIGGEAERYTFPRSKSTSCFMNTSSRLGLLGVEIPIQEERVNISSSNNASSVMTTSSVGVQVVGEAESDKLPRRPHNAHANLNGIMTDSLGTTVHVETEQSQNVGERTCTFRTWESISFCFTTNSKST